MSPEVSPVVQRRARGSGIFGLIPLPEDHHRPDIDGLRAIAVMAVLAFHAFPALIPGGFVGVDVFFVISGYLISGILFKSLETSSFRFLSFYARRARRILPALVLVVIATALIAYPVLAGEDWRALCREIIAACAFAANFLFLNEAGYFDQASTAKPLLHLWSLAVEEQFYLLWPLLLWACRKKRSAWKALLLISFALSFAANLWLTLTDASAAFYSPVSRFWEIDLGAMIAWLQIDGEEPMAALHARFSRALRIRIQTGRDLLGIAGLSLIVLALFLIKADSVFPGILALLPTLGAAALIVAGSDSYVNARFLGKSALVAIGLISYPLYLWHWPLLSLAHSSAPDGLSSVQLLLLLLLSILLAIFTYRVIEVPIRMRVPLRAVALCGMASLVLIAGIAAVLMAHARHSPLEWFDPDPNCIASLDLVPEAHDARDSLFCSTTPGSGPITVAVIGDSTANHLFPGLSRLYARQGERVINVGDGTCAPFEGLEGTFRWNKVCSKVNEKIYRFLLAQPQITTVIWSMAPWDIKNMVIPNRFGANSASSRFVAIAPLVRHDLDLLLAQHKNVVATFDTPLMGIDPHACLKDAADCIVKKATIDAAMQPYVDLWRQLFLSMPGVCVFSQDDVFRTPDGNYTEMSPQGILFRDDHHLSFTGSDVVATAYANSSCFYKP
jgi:peptidoglycan/LPS O-acetylase OafA/YrhL